MQAKEELNNLIFSIGFQMLKILYFQMGLRIRAKCDPIMLKQLFFSKNYEKVPSSWGLCPQTPIASAGWGLSPQTPVNNTFELQCTSLLNTLLSIYIFLHFNCWFKPSPLNEFLVTCQHQDMASNLPFYDIFAPTKNSSFEYSDDVIACDLGFGPPPIKNLGYACG